MLYDEFITEFYRVRSAGSHFGHAEILTCTDLELRLIKHRGGGHRYLPGYLRYSMKVAVVVAEEVRRIYSEQTYCSGKEGNEQKQAEG